MKAFDSVVRKVTGVSGTHQRGLRSPGDNVRKYVKQYTWSNIGAMLRNLRLDPKVCADDFHDRTVVITGATSGIGCATAHAYASHGSCVVSINRN